MTNLNNIINLDLQNKQITVQAGITWEKIQDYIDPYNLSVAVMQSYNDFTVGGSLSVNVHARDLNYGTIAYTVESIKILLADGSLVKASKNENYDLFRSAIGGYGLIGIITEVTLQLTENVALKSKLENIDINNYHQFFENKIKLDKLAVFHNTYLFANGFNKALSITWYKTEEKPTLKSKLQKHKSHFLPKLLEIIVRRIPFLKQARPLVEKIRLIPKVVWRNYEMSYSIKQLALTSHFPTTMTLQEYFIPIEKLTEFLKITKKIFNKYRVNIINISIRHIWKDDITILNYVSKECYSVVFYINIINTELSKEYTCTWTRKLIDAALNLGGTYYLPYLICAHKDQFRKAYPKFTEFLAIKAKYDPTNKFRNMLYEKYL